MSKVIEGAVEALGKRLGDGFDGSACFRITGEGSIIVDGSGVRAAEEPTDVTLIADRDTFEAILTGDLDPTAAFMPGRLKIEGDIGTAMRLGSSLS